MLTCSSTSSNILTLLRPQRVFMFCHSHVHSRFSSRNDFPCNTAEPASNTDRHTDIIFFTNSVTHSQIDNDDDRLRNTFNLNTLGGGGGGRSRKALHSSTIQKRLKPCDPFPASRTSRRRLVLHLGPQNDQQAIDKTRLPYLIPTPNVRTHQNRHTITLATEIYVFLCLPQCVLDRENVCDRAECRGA